MQAKQLREVHQARPFQPFTLCLADGKEVSVDHPELLMITPGGRTVVVAVNDDAVKILDTLLITSIELNGRKPRQRRKKA